MTRYDIERNMLSEGVAGILRKPFTINMLISELENLKK